VGGPGLAGLGALWLALRRRRPTSGATPQLPIGSGSLPGRAGKADDMESNDKPLMTTGAERILRWSFLVPLVLLLAAIAIGVVAKLAP
jgi:hypothetical protein